ncbi:MAG: LysR family transcriptional regulator [Marinomonas sp.]|uniref:LysR family transcriptional regulator n=1 Tax=Gammaproteobacteria TaxID=1236 RepID=UPI00311DB613
MRISPESLRLFISVIEQGSISRAAEVNHIAASAISKRIKELEILLHTPLIMRNNRGIKPTPAGRTLINLSRGVLNQLDDIYDQMNDFSHGVKGQVRMVANISAISQFLPKQLRSFLNKHPLVQIHLEEKISSEIIRAVAENEADIGIVSTASDDYPNLSIYPYKTDRLVVITPIGHPLNLKKDVMFVDTLDYAYVGLHTGSAINNQMLKTSFAANTPLNMLIQVTNYEALCSMVESGLGIGLMPIDIARPYIKTARIEAIPLLDEWAHRDLKLCIRNSNELLDAAYYLLDHLRTT